MFPEEIEPKLKALKSLKWKNFRRLQEVALNLSLIDREIKPGFVWNLEGIDTPAPGLLASELKTILPDIFVLRIAVDYFISSRKSFNKHLQNLESNFPTVIDVNENLSELSQELFPQKLSKKSERTSEIFSLRLTTRMWLT